MCLTGCAARDVYTVSCLQSYLGLLLLNEMLCGEDVTLCQPFANTVKLCWIAAAHRQSSQANNTNTRLDSPLMISVINRCACCLAALLC